MLSERRQIITELMNDERLKERVGDSLEDTLVDMSDEVLEKYAEGKLSTNDMLSHMYGNSESEETTDNTFDGYEKWMANGSEDLGDLDVSDPILASKETELRISKRNKDIEALIDDVDKDYDYMHENHDVESASVYD